MTPEQTMNPQPLSARRPVLLVDDSPMDVDLARRAFAARKLSNPLAVARDGEEALAHISRWEAGECIPVVILLDIKLPRMSGLDVLQQIKTHPRFSAIPVVMLTTSSETSDVAMAYQLGANSYIVKPMEFDEFLEVAGQIDTYWCALNRSMD
jgi:CheY-like chemotaxis protein